MQTELTDFLAKTQLDQLRPEADLTVTVPGEYAALLEHIKVHRYFMGIDQDQSISYSQAVVHWYDTFYLPIVDVIHKRGLLREFEGRTATDLYLFITQHMSQLKQTLGWDVTAAIAASDIKPRTTGYEVSSIPKRDHAYTYDNKAENTDSKQSMQSLSSQTSLFGSILVAIDGLDRGWNCFNHAAIIGQREEGTYLRGLHVKKAKNENHSETLSPLQEKFTLHCENAGLPGSMAVESGDRIKHICQRARYTDLTIVCVSSKAANTKLGSGLSRLLRSCPRPLLAVPESESAL